MWNKLNSRSKKIIIVLGVVLLIFSTMTGIAIWGYNTYIYEGEKKIEISKETLSDQEKEEDSLTKEEVEKGDVQQEETTEYLPNQTIAIIGKDDTASLTDLVLVVNFNSQTNETDVISIPRDTYVVWSDMQREYLKHEWRWTTTSKLTEMSSMGGIENIRGTTLSYVESIIGQDIDHYVIIDTNVLVELVDAIGGVEVDVPERMYYTDYSQGLYIDLYPGLQVLDGEQSEGFVRFRSTYQMGDLDRIEVQKLFMEAFAKKVTSPSIIMDIPNIINVIFDSVKTDIKFTEIGEYIPYLLDFDMEKLSFHTLPGVSDRIEGRDVYVVNEEETHQLISQVFER